MAGVFPSRGEFSLPSELIREHEWLSDYLIDNGQTCTLVYPQKEDSCPNCIQDIDTGGSTGVYKAGGPKSFTNYTMCPWCNGVGRLYKNEEETMMCRVYYNSKHFMSNSEFEQSGKITVDKDTIQIVTYLTNMSKLERAVNLIVDSNVRSARQYRCQPLSQPIPHGFNHDRYVVQLWKRVG